MQRRTKPRRQLQALPSPATLDLRQTALLLDVDGTLLDIAATPDGVVVPPSLRADLQRLLERSGGGVALVSGRTIGMLDRLFAPIALPAIGGHGAEMRIAANGTASKRHPPILGEALRERLHALSHIDPRLLIEDKLHSVAIHYRLAPQRKKALEREIAVILSEPGTEQAEILRGKAVIEIKQRQLDKGTAVRELMTYPPFVGRRPLFIGDDVADESVFAVLPSLGGAGFSVENLMPGADGVIPSPGHVRKWLAELAAYA